MTTILKPTKGVSDLAAQRVLAMSGRRIQEVYERRPLAPVLLMASIELQLMNVIEMEMPKSILMHLTVEI